MSRIFCRMMATPLDLPTPVAPRMAKWRLTRLVDVDVHADIGVLLQVADMRMVGVGCAIDQAQLALARAACAPSPMFGYSVTPRWKRAAPMSPARISPSRSSRATLRAAARRPAPYGLLADLGDQADDQRLCRPSGPRIFRRWLSRCRALRVPSSTVACAPETEATRPSIVRTARRLRAHIARERVLHHRPVIGVYYSRAPRAGSAIG